MTEVYRLYNILAWRIEYFVRILSMLDSRASETLVLDLFRRERYILAYCRDAKTVDELSSACKLVMWAYQVADCVLNYESSNADSAIRHIDCILGEKNA